MSRQESPAHKETLELRKFRTQADRKKEREGENTEKQGEGRESRGPWKEGRRGRGCWERRREPLHKRLSAEQQEQQESAASGSAEQHFVERCCTRRSKTRWPPGARLCLAARVAPGGTLGASAEGGCARVQPWRGQPGREEKLQRARSASRTRGQRGRAGRARVGLPPRRRHEGSARELSAQTCRPSAPPRTGRLRAQRRCRVLASACTTVDRAKPGRTRNGGRRP